MEYTYYRAKIKDDYEIESENILKSKSYYFREDIEKIAEDFVNENKKRGNNVKKNNIIIYGYCTE